MHKIEQMEFCQNNITSPSRRCVWSLFEKDALLPTRIHLAQRKWDPCHGSLHPSDISSPALCPLSLSAVPTGFRFSRDPVDQIHSRPFLIALASATSDAAAVPPHTISRYLHDKPTRRS